MIIAVDDNWSKEQLRLTKTGISHALNISYMAANHWENFHQFTSSALLGKVRAYQQRNRTIFPYSNNFNTHEEF